MRPVIATSHALSFAVLHVQNVLQNWPSELRSRGGATLCVTASSAVPNPTQWADHPAATSHIISRGEMINSRGKRYVKTKI